MNRFSNFLGILIKIFIVLAIIGVIALVYSTCAGGNVFQRIDKTLPDKTVAPFEITTITKIYFAKNAIPHEDKSVTMYQWYEKDDGKWVYRDDEIRLLPILHPIMAKRQ